MSKARDIASAAPAPSTVSATEIGYLDGVTSAIQTQLDAKTAKSTLTTTGDIYYASAANTPARLGIGTASQLLAVNSGATAPEWVAAPSSGGITLLSTTTLSGASTTITVAANSYKQLIAVAEGIDATANHNPSLQINAITGGYINARYGGQGNPVTQQRIISSDNNAWLGWQSVEGYGTDTDNIATTYFFNPNDTRLKNIMTYTSFYGSTTSAYAVLTNVVTVPASAVISSIVYKTDSTFTAGTVKVYGVN